MHGLRRTGTIIGSVKTETDPGIVTALGNGLVAVTLEPSGIYEVTLVRATSVVASEGEPSDRSGRRDGRSS